MIYLSCEVKSGLGEDTFWTWFSRSFPKTSFELPKKLNPEDILMRYSTLGYLPVAGKQIAICWELIMQMRDLYDSECYDEKISKIYETARYCTYRTVATEASVKEYSKFGSVEVIPIGVDTDLFRPIENKHGLREKYNLPQNKKIGVWIGTPHHMKGFAKLLEYAAQFPEIHWVIIWKWEPESGNLINASNFVKIPQAQICELINAADFFFCTSRLHTYYMGEWEAMACDIPFVYAESTIPEFPIDSSSRQLVFQHGWDRKSVQKKWEDFFERHGVEYK